MTLQDCVEEYVTDLAGRLQGDEFEAAVLAAHAYGDALQQEGIEETNEVSFKAAAGCLFALCLDPELEDEVVESVCAAVWGFSEWLDHRGHSELRPLASRRGGIERDIQRCRRFAKAIADALAARQIHKVWEALDEGESESIGDLDSGLHHLTDPQELDLEAAELDYFEVRSSDGTQIMLQTDHRDTLGEAPIAPVLLPPGAEGLLRPGDTIHCEVAPGEGGWRITELFALEPGGYA